MPSLAKLKSLASLHGKKGEIRDLLEAWNDGVQKDCAKQTTKSPTLLAYICDSHHATESLSLNVLQGTDRLRAICLRDLCSRMSMGLYLADRHRTRYGVCESSHPTRYGNDDGPHSIDMVDEDYSTLTNMFNLDGNKVASGMDIDTRGQLRPRRTF